MQNIHWQSTRYAVCGVTATGKTTWAEKYIRNAALSKYDQVIICDWQDGEFFRTRFLDVPDYKSEVTSLAAMRECDARIVCYNPVVSDDYDVMADDFAGAVLDMQEHDTARVLVVVDELGQIYNHGKLPRNFKRLTVAGRRLQIDTLYLCHQLNELHYTLRNMLDCIALFRQTDALGVKWLEDRRVPCEGGILDYQKIVRQKTGEYFWYDIRRHAATREKLF